MLTEKAIAICVLRILAEYTDETHPMTSTEIIAKLEAEYDLSPDRRTIYAAIDTLIELDYDISKEPLRGKGYYLITRPLDVTEVQLMTDAVYSFPFISEAQTTNLVKELQSFLSRYSRRVIHNLSVVRSGNKSLNKSVFVNLGQLDEAIDKCVKIRFDYLEYGTDLKLKPRRSEKYLVNPYGMVYCNEHYYLACVYDGSEKASLYRLDRIASIEVTDLPRDTLMSREDVKTWMEHAVYAQVGFPESVTIQCRKKYLGDVVDKFGTDIWVADYGNDMCRAVIHSNHNGIKYWALQYMEHIEVLQPESLREEIRKAIKGSAYLKDDGPEGTAGAQ